MGKESITSINRAEAEVAMKRLAWLNQALPELVDWFERNPNADELWCFRLFRLEEGLKRLEAFLPEMRRAMQSHAKGNPLGPNSSKARKPSVKELVAHSKDVLKKHQQAAKKTTKKKPQ